MTSPRIYSDDEINFIIDYTNGAFVSGVVGYIVKSGTENFLKIKNNSTNS